jgi:Xaa-Pro aminopeptidase
MPQSRLERLRARMVETDTDLVVVGPSSHMMWLTGVSPHGDERPVFLVVTADYAGFLMPSLNADAAREDTDLPFHAWTDADGPKTALSSLLDAAAAKRPGLTVAIDETMRADFALLLLDALDGVGRRDFLDRTVGYLRTRKDDSEYELLKKNALINDSAMRAAFAALKPGMMELDVVDVLQAEYKRHGARGEFTIVGFGENGAFPHHHSSERLLKAGEAVLIDIGGRAQGYPSDMTRVGFCGEPPEEFRRLHTILERAVQAAIAAAKPGVKAKEVDKAARDVISEAGYGEFFLHRTGHGLGIDIHEAPYITATSEHVLEDGNVFSIEPGIYLAGKFGLRLEEVVILRRNRAEVLSELPRRIFEISP